IDRRGLRPLPTRRSSDLEDRQALHDPTFFRDISQTSCKTGVSRLVDKIFSLEDDLSGRAVEKPHDAFQGGGLARPVASKQGHDFTRVYLKLDVLQDVARRVPGIEFFDG